MSLTTSNTFLTDLFTSLSQFHPSLTNKPASGPASVPSSAYHPANLNPTLPSNPLLERDSDPTSGSQAEKLKPLFTTLHLLFPNELLPALDLLDRGLVSRLVTRRNTAPETADAGHEPAEQDLSELFHSQPPDPSPGLYIVRSSASSVGRGLQFSPRRGEQGSRTAAAQGFSRPASYEVRLTAWNCSCPAFAFEIVAAMAGEGVKSWEDDEDQGLKGEYRLGNGWRYGGLRVLGRDGERRVPICKHLLACLLVEKCPLLGQGVVMREISGEEMAGWSAGWGN